MEFRSEENITEKFLNFDNGKAKHLLASIKTAAENKDFNSFTSSFSDFLDLSHKFSYETCMAINLTNSRTSASSTTSHVKQLVATKFLENIDLPKDLNFISSISNVVDKYKDKVKSKDYTDGLVEDFFISFRGKEEGREDSVSNTQYVIKARKSPNENVGFSFEDLKRLSNEFSVKIAEANNRAADTFVFVASQEIHHDIYLERLNLSEQAKKRNEEMQKQTQVYQQENNTGPKL